MPWLHLSWTSAEIRGSLVSGGRVQKLLRGSDLGTDFLNLVFVQHRGVLPPVDKLGLHGLTRDGEAAGPSCWLIEDGPDWGFRPTPKPGHPERPELLLLPRLGVHPPRKKHPSAACASLRFHIYLVWAAWAHWNERQEHHAARSAMLYLLPRGLPTALWPGRKGYPTSGIVPPWADSSFCEQGHSDCTSLLPRWCALRRRLRADTSSISRAAFRRRTPSCGRTSGRAS